MCTIPQSINRTVMGDTLTNWPHNCPCKCRYIWWIVLFYLCDFVRRNIWLILLLVTRTSLPYKFWIWKFSFAIAIEPSPWCVFFPSTVARSWSVLSPTSCRKLVSYMNRWLPRWHHVSQYFVCVWSPETCRCKNTIRDHPFMTSTKNCLFFGPYSFVHFEARPLRNIDCGHLNFSLTFPRPLFEFFFIASSENFVKVQN